MTGEFISFMKRRVPEMSTRVAIVATGDMGNATGRLLREGGATVSTCLADAASARARWPRRPASRWWPTTTRWCAAADVFLSIIPPGEVLKLAERIAGAMKRTGAKPVYVDCNAVSAQPCSASPASSGRPAPLWSTSASSARRRPRVR